MTPENFCYWLKGFFELQSPTELTETQVAQIRDHLNLVFLKVTPERAPFNFIKTEQPIGSSFSNAYPIITNKPSESSGSYDNCVWLTGTEAPKQFKTEAPKQFIETPRFAETPHKIIISC
jgi:hypothetical protein